MEPSGIFATIEFQMSLLLFVALAGYIVASKINQSAVIAEIVLGIIIGPSLLGWITYTDFVAGIAHLGALILLFVIGLEFKLNEVFNVKYGVIALAGVIVPWIAGYFLAMAFGYGFGAAVFVGTALTATSIAITANVLKEMGKLQSETAKAIIGAAVIDDVLGLLALSMTSQIVSGDISFMPIAITLLKAAIFMVAGGFLGSVVLSRWVEKLDHTSLAKKFPEVVFIFAMSIAFLYSMGAAAIGLSGIVGAFLAGVSLESAKVIHSKDYKHGAEYLHIIFASIFFVSLGIMVNTHELPSPVWPVMWFLLALTVVAVLSKVIGCFIPAKLYGMSIKDSAIIGFGMSPRGEVAMIVALIGLTQSLINQEIYISLVLMSLITTIITPLILRNWLYKDEKTLVASH